MNYYYDATQMMDNLSLNLLDNTSDSHALFGDSTDEFERPSFTIFEYIQQIMYITIIVTGVIGNTFVLIIFGSHFTRQKTFDIYLINLAIADLLGVLIIPIYELHFVRGGDFVSLNDIGCKIIHFLKLVSVTASALILLIISFDRFMMVKWPMRDRLPRFTLTCLILLPWMLASFHGSIYLSRHLKIVPIGRTHQCIAMFSTADIQAYQTVTFLVQNIIPLILNIILYSSVVYELKKSNLIFENNIRETLARKKRNKKTIKLAFIMVVVFLICTVPHNAYLEWYAFDMFTISIHKFISVHSRLKILFVCNCCLNPFIYARLHKTFRKNLMNVFTSRRLRNYSQSRTSTATLALHSTTESAHDKYNVRKIATRNINRNNAITKTNAMKETIL